MYIELQVTKLVECRHVSMWHSFSHRSNGGVVKKYLGIGEEGRGKVSNGGKVG